MIGSSQKNESKERNLRTTVVTAADPVTPDASFTSPLLTFNKHHGGYCEAHMR
jgi:hypothetical protein